MTREDFEILSKEFITKAFALMHGTKAQHYAGQEDRLAAFRKGGAALHMLPEHVCIAYMTKHWVHLVDMVADAEVRGIWRPQEEWDEVLTDLINYCVLMKGLLEDGTRIAIDRLYGHGSSDVPFPGEISA
jgi:hypothetical protein